MKRIYLYYLFRMIFMCFMIGHCSIINSCELHSENKIDSLSKISQFEGIWENESSVFPKTILIREKNHSLNIMLQLKEDSDIYAVVNILNEKIITSSKRIIRCNTFYPLKNKYELNITPTRISLKRLDEKNSSLLHYHKISSTISFDKVSNYYPDSVNHNINEKKITFSNDKAHIKLSGTLAFPYEKDSKTFIDSISKHPAIILLCGSGPHGRDYDGYFFKTFKIISDYFVNHGYAVLRYDKRGCGMSEGDSENSELADYADDVDAAFAYLQSLPNIDSLRIGIIGHSQGATIGEIAKCSQKISFLVSLAGMADNGLNVMANQLADMAISNGQTAKQAEIIRQMAYCMDTVVRHTDKIELESIRERVFSMYDKLNYKSLRDKYDKIFDGYIKNMMKPENYSTIYLDPKKYIMHLKCPVLAIYGDQDLLINSKSNSTLMEKYLQSSGNRNIQIKVYLDLNHNLQKMSKKYNPQYFTFSKPIDKDVLDDILHFISSKPDSPSPVQ